MISNQTEETPETEIPKRKYRRNPDRHKPDGTYDNAPLDPDYFKNYYHNTKKPTQCDVCGKLLASKNHMDRHKSSNKCFLTGLRKHVNLDVGHFAFFSMLEQAAHSGSD